MKVSRKILLGYSVLVLLMTSGIGYELFVIYRLQEINNRLSEVNFRSGELATRLGENRRDVAEFSEKYLLIDGYEVQLEESRDGFDSGIRAMVDSVRSDSERRALEQLRATWQEFQETFRAAQADRPDGGYDFMPVRLEAQLGLDERLVHLIVVRTPADVLHQPVLCFFHTAGDAKTQPA